MSQPIEERLRKALPILRLMVGFIPLPVLRRLSGGGSTAGFPGDVRQEVIDADGVRCEWLIPQQAEDRVMLYLHGGGFVLGWYQMHRTMVAHLAKMAGMKALAVDYRLAPEHPFPAALDDCVAAYRWLLKQGYKPEQIVIAGDSAGGHLTLTTLLKLRDAGDPLPAAGACLSPVGDLHQTKYPADDEILHPRAMKLFRSAFVGKNDPTNPLISPIFADFRGLPPLLIHAGEVEMLSRDAEIVAERAQQAGVDVTLEIYPRMWHAWQIFYPQIPQAGDSLQKIAGFLRKHGS
jgi:acetyl esterase/lipase